MRPGVVPTVINKTLNYFMQENQQYLATLYSAIFATMYFGMLRVGEVAKGDHPIWARDVHIVDNKRKLMFILRSSKTHDFNVPLQRVKITVIARNTKIIKHPNHLCAYRLLRNFANMRPKFWAHSREQFFVFRDRTPVTTAQVRSVLKKMLQLSGFNYKFYNTLSMRSGRSIDLLHLGVKLCKK